MVGLILVSHSALLAGAVKAFALTMAQPPHPTVELAAGVPADDDNPGGFGTDATQVVDALDRLSSEEGVVIIADLGSAVLSAELAVELSGRDDVDIVSGAFVEATLAATLAASLGQRRAQVVQAARSALPAPEVPTVPTDPHRTGETEVAVDAPTREDTPDVTPDALVASTVRNRMGIHARPAAEIARVASRYLARLWLSTDASPSVRAVSPTAVLGIDARQGDRVWILADGPDADEAATALKGLIETGFGEADVVATNTEALNVQLAADQGVGLSPGRVVGKVLRALSDLSAPNPDSALPTEQRGAEAARIPAAASEVAAEVRGRASEVSGAAHQVLQATAMLAEDQVLQDEAMARVRLLGESAERAVWETLSAVALRYERAGGTLRERAADVRDLRSRLLGSLTGVAVASVPIATVPHILVADDVSPVDATLLNPKTCLGLVLSQGGPTSHTTIIARNLGIPLVIHPDAVLSLTEGSRILIDGSTGELIVKPSEAQQKTARSTPLVLSELAPAPANPTLRDGRPLRVLGNVSTVADAVHTVERGGMGAGLVRTEFLFLDRTTAPGRDEQAETYTEILRSFSSRPVTFRTLDAGSDKPLSFLTRGHEPNAALGVRGIRTALRDGAVLDTQLEAIAHAQAAVPGADVRVMAPMIATVDEARAFAERARVHGLRKVGVMVETPSAVAMARELGTHVDFFSIGTNDLTQYVLAADRLSPELAGLNSTWQPSVLRMIRNVVRDGHGLEIGVCGEDAADPMLAAVLIGLGVTQLSVSPGMIPVVTGALAPVTMRTCKQAAKAAISADTAESAREAAAGRLTQLRANA